MRILEHTEDSEFPNVSWLVNTVQTTFKCASSMLAVISVKVKEVFLPSYFKHQHVKLQPLSLIIPPVGPQLDAVSGPSVTLHFLMY